MSYAAPIADMRFALDAAAGVEEVSPELVGAILAEAAKLAEEVVAPLNQPADRCGSVLENGVVRTPPGFREAYAKYVEGGWNGLSCDPEFGGQGLPLALAASVAEMWNAACMSWALCPLLNAGAVELLARHGSDEQKRLYLGRLVSGEWTGTMNLTEPQAGSDLGALRTRAVPDGGRYRITGQKIFITWGDHDMAANIVHMVLARTPDAPPGSHGVSLFLVPKFLPGENGGLGPRNGVRALSLERKLGIHASPTCLLDYEDAVGWRIGGENRGLECMFAMMNLARLQVGVQGLAIAERAYQQARDFARVRVQGRPLGAPPGSGELPIIYHPDVRRMLLWMRAATEAMRALAYYAAALIDRGRRLPDARARDAAQRRADFLIPVVKAWCSDLGVAVASTGIQVHGGMGYIEETGAAQHLRDARIAPIYEGTNGIQANDLVGRKLARDRGEAARGLARRDARHPGGACRQCPAGAVALRPRRRARRAGAGDGMPHRGRARPGRGGIGALSRNAGPRLRRLAAGAPGARRAARSCRRRGRQRLSRGQAPHHAVLHAAFPRPRARLPAGDPRRRDDRRVQPGNVLVLRCIQMIQLHRPVGWR